MWRGGKIALHCVCEDATENLSWGHFEPHVYNAAFLCHLAQGLSSSAYPPAPLDALLGSFQLTFSALGMHLFTLPTHTLVPQGLPSGWVSAVTWLILDDLRPSSASHGVLVSTEEEGNLPAPSIIPRVVAYR